MVPRVDGIEAPLPCVGTEERSGARGRQKVVLRCLYDRAAERQKGHQCIWFKRPALVGLRRDFVVGFIRRPVDLQILSLAEPDGQHSADASGGALR